ncbi:aminoglycoside phosphotransferase family protein [Kitasatospora sp. NBC_00240]|uniref:aminoglycoside phosphotransferase family protein n=1 Tax=Kitasatospora sp. NBC_00240 TaxID=2903567 RepID=UPI002250DF11|nr:aminoglycoside phosphotransferase family protein [Kitasatospora sp. NBC_00240]MCX5209067.1 aminoglycoside phosphotransferase family protein [Kitasatospora sp. NBC_00240]
MVESHYKDGRAGIDAELVRRLIRAQFPQWGALPVRPVAVDGWDNRTYRLGDTMTVRLPTAAGYAPAVDKENRWLPVLAPSLPVPVPRILARGVPGEGYPFTWSVRGWLEGESADRGPIDDLPRFAVSVGEFLLALQRIEAADGPAAGAHSFHRGAPPAHYDEETRTALAALTGRVDTGRAAAVWQAALAAGWQGSPVWFHGDIGGGNLLVRDGKLAAVIDFGTSGVGDPACDLVIAWTMFSGDSREAFRATVGQDGAMWARARGWALWKALICLAEFLDSDPVTAAEHRRVLDEVLADHDLFG